MEFADFFANAVVGEIDSRYRTVQDKAHRFVAGSSMGGLISAYTILAYPDTFGKAGVFSLASMMAELQFLEFAEFQGRTEGNQFYIMVGAQEGKNHTTGTSTTTSQFLPSTAPCTSCGRFLKMEPIPMIWTSSSAPATLTASRPGASRCRILSAFKQVGQTDTKPKLCQTKFCQTNPKLM